MNRGYSLGGGSQRKVATTELSMRMLVDRAIYVANTRKLYCPDFSIIYGYRTASEQYEIYTIGRAFDEAGKLLSENPLLVKTYCDGYEKLSSHQSRKAIDFAAWVDNKSSFEDHHMMAIALCFFEAASELNLDIDWGGSYRSISDLGHIEIIGEY